MLCFFLSFLLPIQNIWIIFFLRYFAYFIRWNDACSSQFHHLYFFQFIVAFEIDSDAEIPKRA